MHKSFSLKFLPLVVFISSTVSAQVREVTIEDCINIALQNHPEIAASNENQSSAVSNYKAAQAAQSVIIDASAKTVEYLNSDRSQSQVNIPGRDTTIGLFAGLGASYNIYDPRRSARIDSSRISIDIAKMNSIHVRQTIISNVKKSYYQFGLARESSRLYSQLLERYKEKLAKTKILYRIGQRSALDVSKSEVDLESSRLDYERSKNNENATKNSLLSSMGLIEDTIDFVPSAVQTLPDLKYSIDELYNLSLYNYTELKMVKHKKDLGKINISIQKASHYPTVDIAAAFGFENKTLQGYKSFEENFQGDNWSPTVHAGFTASMPIYSGGAISSKVDDSISLYNAILYEEKKLQIKVKNLIRSSYQSMIELKKQSVMSRLMLENAKKHLILSQRYYETGSGTQFDIRDAELSVLNSEMSLLKAQFGYLISLSELSYIVGLGEDYICLKK